jgi:hypothetical protein
MTRRVGLLVGLLLGLAGALEAGTMRMVVADLPYARVWDAAVRAVRDYPSGRTADGVIETGWLERSPREGEGSFSAVMERVTVRVEPFAEQITRVTVDVEARGWRDGQWVAIPDTAARERIILDRVREAS